MAGAPVWLEASPGFPHPHHGSSGSLGPPRRSACALPPRLRATVSAPTACGNWRPSERGAVDAGIPARRLLPACNAIACLKRLLETPRSAFFAEVRRRAWAGRLGGGPGEEGRPPQRVNLQEASLWPLEVWPELLKHRTSEPRGGPWGRPRRVESGLQAREANREGCEGDHNAGHVAALGRDRPHCRLH